MLNMPNQRKPLGKNTPGWDCRLFRFLAVASGGLPILPPGEEIYDLRDPVRVPFPWTETILYYAIIFIFLWVIWKFLAWVTQPGPVPVPPPPPPPDPLEEALAAFDRLRSSPLWTESHVKDICESLTGIVKVFLKDRFSLGIGAASTTDELIVDLREQGIKSTNFQAVRELFVACDEVKFAKGSLGARTVEDLFNDARNLVIRKDWRAFPHDRAYASKKPERTEGFGV